MAKSQGAKTGRADLPIPQATNVTQVNHKVIRVRVPSQATAFHGTPSFSLGYREGYSSRGISKVLCFASGDPTTKPLSPGIGRLARALILTRFSNLGRTQAESVFTRGPKYTAYKRCTWYYT